MFYKRIKNFKTIFDVIAKIGLSNLVSGINGVNRKKSFGSTHPVLVRKSIYKEQKWLKTAYKNID